MCITWHKHYMKQPSTLVSVFIFFSWATQAGNNRQNQSACMCNLFCKGDSCVWLVESRVCVSSLHICIMQLSELSHASTFLQLYLLCALSNPGDHPQCFSSYKWWTIRSVSHSLAQKANKQTGIEMGMCVRTNRMNEEDKETGHRNR